MFMQANRGSRDDGMASPNLPLPTFQPPAMNQNFNFNFNIDFTQETIE